MRVAASTEGGPNRQMIEMPHSSFCSNRRFRNFALIESVESRSDLTFKSRIGVVHQALPTYLRISLRGKQPVNRITLTKPVASDKDHRRCRPPGMYDYSSCNAIQISTVWLRHLLLSWAYRPDKRLHCRTPEQYRLWFEIFRECFGKRPPRLLAYL